MWSNLWLHPLERKSERLPGRKNVEKRDSKISKCGFDRRSDRRSGEKSNNPTLPTNAMTTADQSGWDFTKRYVLVVNGTIRPLADVDVSIPSFT
jgi:hypothetical protein